MSKRSIRSTGPPALSDQLSIFAVTAPGAGGVPGRAILDRDPWDALDVLFLRHPVIPVASVMGRRSVSD